MKNDQALHDIIAELILAVQELRRAVDRLEPRAVNEDEDPQTENGEDTVEESKEEDAQEAIPDPREAETEDDHDLARLLRGLNFGSVSRSAIRVIDREVVPIGFGYDGDKYTSSKGNVWDMTPSTSPLL
jgi:hypothetical protein